MYNTIGICYICAMHFEQSNYTHVAKNIYIWRVKGQVDIIILH